MKGRCIICRKKFNFEPSSQTRKFCSYNCYWFSKKDKPAWNRGLKLNKRALYKIDVCSICNRNFEHLASKKRKVCSKKCQYDYMKKIMVKHSPWNKNKHLSEEQKKKLSIANKGKLSKEKHHNWHGGISFEPYSSEFNEQLKEQIRKRDNHICQECGFTQKQLKYRLCIHHIDFNKKNNNSDNLISLCRSCHSQTNFDRENWEDYFKNKRLETSNDRCFR